ncbi:MAG: hypothetical protein IJZ75_07335 [Clostridia bacterium]|nr:hypothetical protein [Clostridia bacterium]
MRKVFISFLIIVICFVFTGAAVPKESNRLDMVKETIISTAETVAQKETATNVEENSLTTETTQNPEESTEIIVIEETETLSAEDKALKAEIAKISDTKIDFRAQRQDKIGAKTYTSTYKELVDGKYPRIIYESKLENGKNAIFEYSVNSGNLTMAFTPTRVSKTENSITLEEAQKIATNIAKQYCDTSVYKLSKAKESYMFYEFAFARYISGYETAEGVYINIDFNGDLYLLTIGTNIFEDKDFTVDEAKLTAALEKYLAEATPDYTSYEIERQRISVSNGKPVIEYYLTIKSEG